MLNRANKFDRMDVDVVELFKNTNTRRLRHSRLLFRLARRYIVATLIVFRLYVRLVDAGIIRDWYNEFVEYWDTVLGGRPLYYADFNYLVGVYRQKFQSVETPNYASREEFLESWQGPNTLYQLFGAVRRYAHEPLHCYRYEKWLKHGDTILEYGCGVAPICFSLSRFSTKRSLKMTIADIAQINSHYAKWRLGCAVDYIGLEPYLHKLPPQKFDVVFMITVMEHLPDPLASLESVTNSIKIGGTLIFDYILGDGDGQDTIESVEQRSVVISYICENYELIKGRMSPSESMDMLVCRRK